MVLQRSNIMLGSTVACDDRVRAVHGEFRLPEVMPAAWVYPELPEVISSILPFMDTHTIGWRMLFMPAAGILLV